jgi:hypothetical protein
VKVENAAMLAFAHEDA